MVSKKVVDEICNAFNSNGKQIENIYKSFDSLNEMLNTKFKEIDERLDRIEKEIGK
jgi:uncharacterized protein Yka (UPF0111/DUF47 family)